ncbi:radical SAM protein [Clostridium hydrogenum]|uniref:radical SAM protein n=1 Tax=Clostridium hydrogenum TaxID=2855764 RepID=UPI001F42E186|nr:radical SAM protein [Clostridium hydrogenum]
MKKIIAWDITAKCNLRCKHCYNWSLVEDKKYTTEMNLQDCFKFIDKLPYQAHLHLLGGEPLMKDGFLDIVDYLTKKEITYSMVTNGLLLDDTISDSIIKSNVTSITFSLDGPDAITHEKIRGKNTFFRSLNNLINFKEKVKKLNSKITISVNFTINKFNYMIIDKFFKLDIKNLIFNRVSEEGNAINNNLSILDDEWVQACEQIALNTVKYNSNTEIFAKPLLLSYLNTKYNLNFAIDTAECGIKNGNISMYIKNDGTVYPCNKWYKIDEVCKNYKKEHISSMCRDEIELYSNNNSIYKDVLNFSEKVEQYRDEFCISCKLKKYCHGCILDFYKNGKFISNVGECEVAAQKIENYKNTLHPIEAYKIREALLIELNDNTVVVKDIALNKKVILKNRMKDLFLDMYNNNTNNFYKYRNLKNDYIYELKKLHIIESNL